MAGARTRALGNIWLQRLRQDDIIEHGVWLENAVALRSQVGFVSASYLDRCFHNESGFDIVLSAKFGGFGRRSDITDEDVIRARKLLALLQKEIILTVCCRRGKSNGFY